MKRMTESERKHVRRMVKHAEKVRRNMEKLRGTNPFADLKGWHPKLSKIRKTKEYKILSKPFRDDEFET